MLRFVTCFFCINSDDRDDRVLRPSVLLVRCVPLAAFPVLNHPPLLEYIPLGHGASPFKMLLIQCASFFFFFEDFHVDAHKGCHSIVLLSCSFLDFGL